VTVDGKSTGRVDLRAEWQDPFDDLSKPAYNSATDIVEKTMPVANLEVGSPTLNSVVINKMRHTIGDTKYHRISYFATATTRFVNSSRFAITQTPKT